MARAKSAVLSAADKRAVIKDMKAKLKAAELQLKVEAKAKAAAAKAFEKDTGVRDKTLAKLEKTVAKAKADLAAVAPAA